MNTARVRHAPQGLASSLGMEDKNKKCQGSLGHSSTGNVKGGSSARPEWVRVGFLEEVDYGAVKSVLRVTYNAGPQGGRAGS